MDSHLPPSNRIENEISLPKRVRKALNQAGFCTFRGIARVKAGTLLRRVNGLTSHDFFRINQCLQKRGLSFINDDTIIPDGFFCGQKTLTRLWRKGITRYPQLSRYSYWEVVDIIDGTDRVRKRFMALVHINRRRGIGKGFSKNYQLRNAGFTQGVEDMLYYSKQHRIENLDDVTNITETDLIEISIKSVVRGVQRRGVFLREVKYMLWKNGLKLRRKYQSTPSTWLW